jgi:hypothetical protein
MLIPDPITGTKAGTKDEGERNCCPTFFVATKISINLN